jgi:xanthine/CO dehydrogenase XdhC/CoxF family maturation factor
MSIDTVKIADVLSLNARNEDVLATAEAWRREGRKIALATVVGTWGSSPRPIGSHLVVDDHDNFLGSISGGCVEGAVIVEAAKVIRTGEPSLIGFGIADESAWQVGLACGGKISIYIEKVD